MEESFTALQRLQQNLVDLHLKALEKIREAKDKKLKTLNLSLSNLSILPDEIFDLVDLTTLNLSSNGLSSLPKSLALLRNLTTVDLSGNQLTTLPESITQLQRLTTLNLRGNKIRAFPESSNRLSNLTTLNLSRNQFTTLPESITRLPNLTTLDLSDNQLNILPESISQLQKLTALNLSDNKIRAFPESSARLQSLTTLDLTNNEMSVLPESIGRLRNLTSLNLSNNLLSALPESITQLQRLTILKLSNNQLTTIPESIVKLQSLTKLNVSNNPLVAPPLEVSVRGIQALRQYFRQLDKEGVDQLFEAKLLILGEGGAGKTTFARKLLDANYTLKDELSTQGVDVLKWSFSTDGKRKFTTNIWDFGGQEIYHATHQFFLTRRSLYALVADTRKEDTDFYYWLNIAELLSDGSPLLIIKNEKQDRHREINERSLRGQFDSLKEVLATNLATNRGLEQVRKEIEYYLRKLPHIGTPLPKTWVRVREQLEKDPRDYISLEEYLLICKANGFAQAKDALQLSGYLNDIGVFLHFQDEPLLKRTVILKPKWGTDAVYKVLDNKTVIRNLGRFTRLDLEAIWNTPQHEGMRAELLQLMMKFKLCYEIPTQKGNYIAPQLLTENQPDYAWDSHNNLLLRYSYEFMPKGILTQLIVVMHPYIREQRIVWKSGLVIEKDNTRAEVLEYYGKRETHVRVTGPQARDMLTIIRHELNGIHDTYKRLRYDELVRCNCSACKDSREPHFYPVAKLLEMRADNQPEIQCQRKPYEMVNVMKLLGDTIDFSKPLEKDVPASIFVQAQGDIVLGEKTMSKLKQNIQNSIVHGNVVAAEKIEDSFNIVQKADINDDLKEELKQLTQAVKDMIRETLKEKPEQAEKVAVYMQRLSEEAVKKKPDPEWYSVSIDGLIKAAQNLGKVGDAVIELAGKVRKILLGGLL